MWVVLGPFDGETGDTGHQKPKLLKPNTSYTVGRKDRPLLINSKKISHDHCDFVAGPHSVEDVGNPSERPTLKLINRSKKDKSLLITRNGTEVHAYPSSEELLVDDDVVTLISGIHVTVKWIPVCVYTNLDNFRVDECASLGLKLVHVPHADVTHHITTHYVADLPCSASLLSLCHFVTPGWLQEVIRIGMSPRGNVQSTSLEDHFVLPPESKYRPDFGLDLSPAHRALNIWAPNEERVNLFRSYRFICLYEKTTTSDTELREVLHLGGGLLENFDIHSDIQKFRRALSRSQAKEGKKTIVVGDLELMQLTIGGDSWKVFMTEAQSASVPVLSVSKVIEAIMDANIQALFDADSAEKEISSEEPSIPKPSRPRLVRRANSRASSKEPSEVGSQNQESNTAPRRALTRRLVKSTDDDQQSVVKKAPPPELIDLSAPTPRPTKLKRRFGLTKDNLRAPSLTAIEESVTEPPLKKFKALFEETNPESMDFESSAPLDNVGDISPFAVTQTQSGTATRTDDDMDASSLIALREEEEETQITMAEPSAQRTLKRRLISEEDVERLIVDSGRDDTMSDVGGEGEPPSKRRMVEDITSAEEPSTVPSKPASQAATLKTQATSGAAPGKPDTDDAFLKAIASTKRGKKHEDDFDREFNKLRITKPELERQEPEEEWKVLADFGDDSGLRGNFMVIVELEPYERDTTAGSSGLKDNWATDQRPNFKKFKQKEAVGPRPKIELFATHVQSDYGESYWKNSHSQSQRRTVDSQEEFQFQSESQPLWQGHSKVPPTGDIVEGERPKSRKAAPRSDSAKPAPSRSSRQKSSKSKSASKADNTLFLLSDDEFDAIPEDETLRSDVEERPKPPARKKASTAKKPPPRSKKQPVVVVDDDSDDDAVFRGLRAK